MRLPGAALVVLLCCGLSLAQQSPRSYRGSWTATAGAQTFHGRWTGQTLPGRPNTARGTWELTRGSGAAVMRGTWSAERQAGAWEGTFTARGAGSTVAGRWTAYLEETNLKTFQEMLQRALEKEVSGAWDSGPIYGKWWLSSK